MSSVYLSAIKTVQPRFKLKQSDAVAWITQAHLRSQELMQEPENENLAKLVQRYSVSDKMIATRYTDCADFHISDAPIDWERNSIYHLMPRTPHGASIDERTTFFTERALQVLKELYGLQSETQTRRVSPQHLIHVTCTGYDSPSAPQRLVSESPAFEPEITQLYHMGCYASLPAVRLARALVSEGRSRVDVVHNELCSLHLDPSQHTPEQIVVQTLFGDGHALYSLTPEPPQDGIGFEVIKTLEKILPGTQKDMRWIPGAYGMRMTLSRDVPAQIQNALSPFVKKLLGTDDWSDVEFAIHPGGPKVIDAVATALNLKEEQFEISKSILLNNGNLSSATLPYIWAEILKQRNLKKGTPVVSLAFGPGLTVFGALFRSL